MSALVWAGVLFIGGTGSVLRFVVDGAVAKRVARAFPLGTFTVNMSGAAVLGIVTGLALTGDAALLAGTAAVGSYTTFSTWMLETRSLAAERQLWVATTNIVASTAIGLAAALWGQAIAQHF